ncbi:MAG: fatty acid desaturase [Gammaproteobacteria bacterium]|nr:fatty acid desaturase [Gammaproteobacteria bacterium]HJO11358.1 fatty acid desaturase [Gammaproteobacteria bacterium]
MLKQSADRIPITIIVAFSLLDFGVYFWVNNPYVLGLFFYLMIIPKSMICAWNHHHQHTTTFRYKPLNRMLEFLYAMHTGITTNLWVLHHTLGHHNNYLDQTKDESRWQRKDGSQMGEFEYSLVVAATAYYRGFMVGKKYPVVQKDFLFYTFVTFMLLGLLVWYRPVPAIFIFVLPMLLGLFMTAWATYEHHAGLNTKNEFEASFNNVNYWYNLFTGNLGYHTAHHNKGGLHWSKLPELHEQLKEKIPDNLIRTTWV